MKGISLSSVIQVINLERQSCDIEAKANGLTGQMHFREGALVDAVADDLAGEAAAFAILNWKNPEFEVITEDAPRDRTIETELTELLLEVARRQDEAKAELSAVAGGNGQGSYEGVPPALEPLAAAEAAVAAESAAWMEPPMAEPVPVVPVEPAPVGAAPAPAAPVEATPAPAPVAAAAPAAQPAAPAPPAASLNPAALQRVVDIARDGLGDALISADVYSSGDGTPLVGINSQPAACALINQITERMMWSLGKSGLPPLGRYYTAELADSRLLLVAPRGTIQLNLVVDTKRVQLGLLLNVILPEVLSALDTASPQ